MSFLSHLLVMAWKGGLYDVGTSDEPRSEERGLAFHRMVVRDFGGIGTFLGLFILFANDDQYVGIGGDLSWRVGDLSSAWGYGLLTGGVLLLLAAVVMVVAGGRVPAESARQTKGLSELLWHAGIFVVVNAFIWLQDIAIGGGVDYAFWVTIPWGIGLASHAVAYFYSRGRTATLSEGSPQQEPKELQRH